MSSKEDSLGCMTAFLLDKTSIFQLLQKHVYQDYDNVYIDLFAKLEMLLFLLVDKWKMQRNSNTDYKKKYLEWNNKKSL